MKGASFLNTFRNTNFQIVCSMAPMLFTLQKFAWPSRASVIWCFQLNHGTDRRIQLAYRISCNCSKLRRNFLNWQIGNNPTLRQFLAFIKANEQGMVLQIWNWAKS